MLGGQQRISGTSRATQSANLRPYLWNVSNEILLRTDMPEKIALILAKTINIAQIRLNIGMQTVNGRMRVHGLWIALSKIGIMFLPRTLSLLSSRMRIESTDIKTKLTTKYLGVMINSKMSY